MDHTSAPTSVYRYYDEYGALIYVGITSRASRRNREHNGDKDWWPLVVRQEVEHHTDRCAALARERDLIERHQPPFNVQHNRAHQAAVDGYMAARSALAAVAAVTPQMPSRPSLVALPLSVVGSTVTMRTTLIGGPLLERCEAPTGHLMTPIGKARAFRIDGPFLTFRIDAHGRNAVRVESANVRLRYTSLKPPRFAVRSVTPSLATAGDS